MAGAEHGTGRRGSAPVMLRGRALPQRHTAACQSWAGPGHQPAAPINLAGQVPPILPALHAQALHLLQHRAGTGRSPPASSGGREPTVPAQAAPAKQQLLPAPSSSKQQEVPHHYAQPEVARPSPGRGAEAPEALPQAPRAMPLSRALRGVAGGLHIKCCARPSQLHRPPRPALLCLIVAGHIAAAARPLTLLVVAIAMGVARRLAAQAHPCRCKQRAPTAASSQGKAFSYSDDSRGSSDRSESRRGSTHR